MSKLFKLALVCFVAGLILPAAPMLIRGDFEPEGWQPGALVLFRLAFMPEQALEAYQQNRGEPTYDFGHFSEETLMPILKCVGIFAALSTLVLAWSWPRLREGRMRYFAAAVIFIGGACFARILFPGYAPGGNRYYYYIGAYLLILAFPLAAFALVRTAGKP
jgi:hypothetical protein